MKSTRGFTLIELIIVVVLIGILSGVVSPLLYQLLKSYRVGKQINNMAVQTNIAANNVLRELKNASSVSTIGNTTITFLNYQGQTIVIDLNGTNFQRNVDSGGTQTLCNNISSLSFGFYDQSFATTAVAANVRYVIMSLTATDSNTSYSMIAGTTLRKLIP